MDCIRLGGMASTLASTSLAGVIAQIAEEQIVLQKGVGDFETSSAASQMALVSQASTQQGFEATWPDSLKLEHSRLPQILQTLEATADSVGASSRRSQTLAKMLEEDFHLEDCR